jgi:hypothetical protein
MLVLEKVLMAVIEEGLVVIEILVDIETNTVIMLEEVMVDVAEVVVEAVDTIVPEVEVTHLHLVVLNTVLEK